ncbi:MAG: flavohemoglobin expression-modulating QEGLA motif protein [Aeromicrobium sp.]
MAAVAPTRGDLAVEHALANVAENFRFVLDLTPGNVEEQRKAFLRGEITQPVFTYRELEDAPAVLLAELQAIDLSGVEDSALRSLLMAKHREVALQIEMLQARGSADFPRLSQELYGPISTDLVRDATAILDGVPVPENESGARVQAAHFAELAEFELTHYRKLEPDLRVHVDIRPDVAGVMVSGSVLFISATTRIRPSRVEALLQHEVGTHLLTYANGRFQSIAMMASGLAGYEETQEGLAVLAELLVGGLSGFRLRQLAARVVAVRRMLDGDSFAGVYDTLVHQGFSPQSAFTTTMRVFRSGGLTKDAIYLRGFLRVLEHLRRGGDLDPLWMGKLSLEQVPVVMELRERGVLTQPRLLPRFMDFPATAERLAMASSITGVAELIGAIR